MRSDRTSGAETAAEPFESAFAPRIPEQIGGYRVLRLIGQGGMGAVYEAEQQHPRRRVALKVIRAGLLSRSMLRRFSFEVEMLGRLKHPGIAQIHEAGAAETDAGLQPYFAMEYVDGHPLSRHAKDLERNAKLELLARVADAVHYAHQNGIIHRDLKPENILVDHDGQPKVLDFGVARSTNADFQATMQTQTGAIVGTLAYMSPEQAAGEVHEVDVRSDVYALGIIAYQLLTDRLPYDLPRESIVNSLRLIREIEPVPAGRLHKDLRGDIETILLKALEKEKPRRYQSAHDFAADIRRHLNDEPISARPADTMYHLSKFIRRNRVLVGGVAATFLMLVIGLAATTWWWRDAVVHRRLAEQHERDSELRLVRSLIAEGDALSLAGRWSDAKQRHLEALNRAETMGESLLPAQFGFWEDRRHSPEALAVWESPPGPAFIATSPDGRLAVAGGGTLRLWDVARGTILHQLIFGDYGGATAGAFSSDGKSIAIGTGSGMVILWHVEGEMPWTTQVHAGPVEAVAFAPALQDGRWAIMSVGADTSVALLDSAGQVIRRFGEPSAAEPGSAGGAAISPDGRLVALADGKGTVQIWGVEQGTLLRQWEANQGNHAVAFAPDSRHVVTASANKTLQLWDATAGKEIRRFEGHSNGVSSVAISPDGKRLLSGSWDRTVRLWDVATGNLITTWTGHLRPTHAVAFATAVDAVLSGGEDGTIRLWSLRPERQVRTLLASLAGESPLIGAVSLSADGELTAAAGSDGAVRVWDIATGMNLLSIQAHDGGATAVAFLPDSRHVLSGGDDGMLKLWPLLPQVPLAPVLTVTTGDTRIRSMAVSPDGKYALCGGDAKKVLLFDLTSGQLVRHYEHGSAVRSVAFSPDGKLAVCAFEDSSLDIWDPGTGRLVARVSQTRGFQDVNVARFQPGEQALIAAGGWSGVPRLWRAKSPYESQPGFAPDDGHGSTLMALAFTPDGKFLITAGWDNTVRIWDVQRRSLVRALMDHTRPVLSVVASSDGGLVVSGSWDGTVKLWEISSVADFSDRRKAAEQIRRSLGRTPHNAAALVSLGDWYARRGAEPLAMVVYGDAVKAGARVSELQLARCYAALGRWDQARRAYEQARVTSEAPAQYLDLCLAALPPENRVESSASTRSPTE